MPRKAIADSLPGRITRTTARKSVRANSFPLPPSSATTTASNANATALTEPHPTETLSGMISSTKLDTSEEIKHSIGQKDETPAVTTSSPNSSATSTSAESEGKVIDTNLDSFEEIRHSIWLGKTLAVKANDAAVAELITPDDDGSAAKKGRKTVVRKTVIVKRKVVKRVPKRVRKEESNDELGEVEVESKVEVENPNPRAMEFRSQNSNFVNSSASDVLGVENHSSNSFVRMENKMPNPDQDALAVVAVENVNSDCDKEDKTVKAMKKKVAMKGLERVTKELKAKTGSSVLGTLNEIELGDPNSDIAYSNSSDLLKVGKSGSVSMRMENPDFDLDASKNVNDNDENTVRTVNKVVRKGLKRSEKERPDEALGLMEVDNETKTETPKHIVSGVNELQNPNSDIADSNASNLSRDENRFFVTKDTGESYLDHDASVVVAVESVSNNADKGEKNFDIISLVQVDNFKGTIVAKGKDSTAVNSMEGLVSGALECGSDENEGKENSSSTGRYKEEEIKSGKVGCRDIERKEGAKHEVESCEDSGSKGTAMMAEFVALGGEMEALQRQKRRKTEIFIGGLGKDTKEEDVRRVFQEVGEIAEVTMKLNVKTGKNKGFAFLRYVSAADAKKAMEKFAKVEICGKQCNVAPVEGNDTIFLGNIDKTWKNEDIVKLLQGMGIEKIDKVTVIVDPTNTERNRGFAFLEFETIRGAQIAFRILEKKCFFGKHQKMKVAWAEPLSEPDEEEMRKVKTVYAEYLPVSWDEEKLKDKFKKFGEIEYVVLARNFPSSRRKDFAFISYTTREAALACIQAFAHESSCDDGSKVNIKVSLAKPIPKNKIVKHSSNPVSKNSLKKKPKATQSVVQPNQLRNRGESSSCHDNSSRDRASTTDELVQLLREQASWRQPQTSLGIGSADPSCAYTSPAKKRQFSQLGYDPVYSDPRGYHRPRIERSFQAANSSRLCPGVGMTSLPHYHRQGLSYPSGLTYRADDGYVGHSQTGGAHFPGDSGVYYRY